MSVSVGAWVAILNTGRPFFHLADLMKLGQLERDAARKAAQRLLARRLLLRLGPELYANGLRPPSVEAASCALRAAYVSLEHALFLHGLMDQAPTCVTCVTLGRPGHVTTGLGAIACHHVAPRLYRGFTATEDGLLATPEKAFLDLDKLHEEAEGFPERVRRTVDSLDPS